MANTARRHTLIGEGQNDAGGNTSCYLTPRPRVSKCPAKSSGTRLPLLQATSPARDAPKPCGTPRGGASPELKLPSIGGPHGHVGPPEQEDVDAPPAWDWFLLNVSATPPPGERESPPSSRPLRQRRRRDPGGHVSPADGGLAAPAAGEAEVPGQGDRSESPQLLQGRPAGGRRGSERSPARAGGRERPPPERRSVYNPSMEPSIASICRDTFQIVYAHKGRSDAVAASRRHARDADTRRLSRVKAAAWRRARELKQDREQERLRAEHEAERAARQEEREREEAKRRLRQARVLKAFSRIMGNQLQLHRNVVDKLHNAIQIKDEPGMHSADERIERMRKAKEAERRTARNCRRLAKRRSAFLRLPEGRRKMFEDVFLLYDQDRSGQLQAPELVECLLELGLHGVDRQERFAIERICMSFIYANRKRAGGDVGDVGVDLYEFVADVVPAVSRQLNKLRGESLAESLHMLESGDDGRLDAAHVLESVSHPWSLDSNTDGGDQAQVGLMGQLKDATRRFVGEQLEFTPYLSIIVKVAEDLMWNNYALQNQIQIDHALDQDTFKRFRLEIINLDRIFRSCDMDDSGSLNTVECIRLYKQLGLMPTKSSSKSEVVGLMESGGGEIRFARFLELITQIRVILEHRIRKGLRRLFPPWESDPSALMPAVNLSSILKDMCVTPKSSRERCTVNNVIRDADFDGDGHFTFEETAKICRQAQEGIRQVRVKVELEAAIENGFTEQDLNQVRWAFEELDTDESGTLDRAEIQKAMSLLEMPGKADAETDPSGCLDLVGFLKLLRKMENQRDAAAADRDKHRVSDATDDTVLPVEGS